MSRDLADGIDKAYSERTDLLVVALTGRTGSGCTTTASIMAAPFDQIAVSDAGLSPTEVRKFDICKNFLATQWIPFKSISVSTVILSFLIQENWGEVEGLLKNSLSDSKVSSFKDIYEGLREQVDYEGFNRLANQHDQSESVRAWDFYSISLTSAASCVKKIFENKYSNLFQVFGDNIRRSGSATGSAIDSDKIFSLITRVKRLVKAAGKWDRKHGIKSTRVAIDAVRNPLELVYLRDQFAAFFAMALTSNEDERRARLTELGMSKKDADSLDQREYSKKSLDKYENFISQNIQECIQKSDIFLNNPGKPSEFGQNRILLNRQLIRYVALMLRPGLITPTSDERCMQLAFAAKLNSGCISRQVGAAISDAAASIKAVGWNDVPKGQVSCLLRDVGVLLGGHDDVAFSDYEMNTPEFKNLLSKDVKSANSLRTNRGLPCPFCFKDTYNELKKEKNQVHTRSLHAEENAFLQLAKHGNSGIAGGSLYTTASPCELCSKKAFQLGIKEIIFVDPYPGISAMHVLRSGNKDSRPILRLFNGAVGSAYHKLYEPLLPIKDEYAARLKGGPEPSLI